MKLIINKLAIHVYEPTRPVFLKQETSKNVIYIEV